MIDALPKAELLERIASERAALEHVIKTLEEPELTGPVLDDGWSIKDAIAHITAWERRMLRGIEAWKRGDTPAWPEPGATMADVDRLNERDLAANRDRPLGDVLSEARASYAAIVSAVEALPAQELASPTPWSNTYPLALLVRANTDEHYREHLDLIEAWWAGQGA